MSPYSPINDHLPPITLFHGGDDPLVPPCNGLMTAQYSEVKRENMAPHLLPHISTTARDYSVLKRDDISNVPLHNVTVGKDYSVIKRDGVPYNLAAECNDSVLKREDREVS